MLLSTGPKQIAGREGIIDMKDIDAEQRTTAESEDQVIARAQRGDTSAFETLYKTHGKRVYNLCLRMLKNTAEAEDLTQQVFLQLFRKISSFRSESGFSTWLHRVAVNMVLMHLRNKKQIEISIDDPGESSTAVTEQSEFERADRSMFGAIDRMNLFRAIRKLPSGCKQLFLLHHVFGYKHSEIVRLLGCSVGCSKSQVHRARKRLQEMLREGQAIGKVANVRG
jgi:RNA polymerase sigma-70 factor (ECF subfamily)